MADEQNYQHHQAEKMNTEERAAAPIESTDRGLFHFGDKKEENKPQEEAIVTDFEKVKISEAEEKKHGIGGGVLEKLHRADSSSSSSSSDEEGDDEEKKKRRKERKEKKGLKEKLKEKIPGHKKEGEENKHEEDTAVPIEKCEEEKEKIHVQEAVYSEPSHPEEKKGFLDKIKDKLPGQHKKTEDAAAAPVAPADLAQTPECEATTQTQTDAEKKGFLDKIKDKISGFSSKGEEEKKEKEKEKEKECAPTT